MRRNITQLTLTALTSLMMTGCPIWWDDFGSGGSSSGTCDPGDPCMAECVQDDDCLDGYWCRDEVCEPSGWCTFGCPPSWMCDEDRDTCVPPEGCVTDADCDRYDSYCDEELGECVATGSCSSDLDCASFGESFICDDGVCAPDEGPCPDGHCGCTDDLDCEAGLLCEQGLCRAALDLCTYDHQCSAGQVCANSFCVVDCSTAVPCPTGQVCSSGICVDDADGGDACLYASDCAAEQSCVNGYCLDRCSSDSDCGYYTMCLSGLCRPDERRLESCTTAGCDTDLFCVDDGCRPECDFSVDCQLFGDMSECVGGYCITPHEMTGECARSADCGSGLCVDGACL